MIRQDLWWKSISKKDRDVEGVWSLQDHLKASGQEYC